MNTQNAHLYIPIVEALRDKELQFLNSYGIWEDCEAAIFGLPPERYRRKPKPREFLAVLESDGSGMLYQSAEQFATSFINKGRPTIRVREVLE